MASFDTARVAQFSKTPQFQQLLRLHQLVMARNPPIASYDMAVSESIHDVPMNDIDDHMAKMQAIEMFGLIRPNYDPIQNLATDVLYEQAKQGVQHCIDSQASFVVIDNGCCTMENCPAVTFKACVIRAIQAQARKPKRLGCCAIL